jgi:VWFA-related protein
MQLFGPFELTLPTQMQTAPVCFVAKLGRICSMARLRRQILIVSLLLVLGVGIQAGVAPSPADEGIHIDLPSNGQLRVENQFGDIYIRIGKERDVAVAARIEGAEIQAGAGFNRLPVVIETKQNLLSISVVSAASARSVRIDLSLRIPENTRAEIITNEGRIISRGLSASMSLNTVGGPILAELETPLNADIVARSSGGFVRSQMESTSSADSHDYRSRFGSGQKVLRANSQRGEIILSTQSGSNLGGVTQQRAPELRPTPGGTAGAGTPANQSATEEIDEGDVIRVDAQLVTLNLSVVDRSTNRGLVGLAQSDFKLFENGVEQRLLQFESSAAPFDLVLVIDLSGSTRDVVKLIRAAALRFVDAARPSDRIAIITFAGSTTVVSPLTLDREALRQRVNAIDTLSGDTKLYDAGDFAMAEVVRETKNSRRAAIVLMSDGLDGSIPGVQGEGSKLSYQELLNGIREFDGVLYSLWLDTYYEALNPQDTQPEAFDTGHDRMKEMADAGGGLFYEVEGLQDLAGAYERVVADLGTVYSLAYRPLNKSRDRKWRAIRVTVDRGNAVARGKHGYYAN